MLVRDAGPYRGSGSLVHLFQVLIRKAMSSSERASGCSRRLGQPVDRSGIVAGAHVNVTEQ